MTKQALRDEIVKCGKDPAYFIRKYVRIQHPVRGIIPFNMFVYQEKLIKDYVKYRFNIILKARQLGISEITAAYASWLMLFHKDKNILVMASKAETAKNIIRKVQVTLKNLPKWIVLADVTTDNKLSIEMTNGSRIKAIATSGDAGRSEAVSLLIVDEAAFIEKFDELWTGLYPTVQAGGRAIILSTPKGVGNKFHKLYVDAEDGENEFNWNKFMWWEHPDRISDIQDDPNRKGFKTSSWYRNEIKSANMGLREISQEMECAFNSSGDTVVGADQMEHIQNGLLEPLEKSHWDRNIFIWSQPKIGERYFIPVDVSRGDGKDFSSAHVFDTNTMIQQAEYYGKIPPDEFGRLLVELGNRYNKALLVIENNNVGLACIEHVKLAGYENVYYSRKSDSKTGEIVNTAWGVTDQDLIAGFTTTARTRPLIVAKLEEYIRNRTLVIRSKRFFEELRTYIWNNGRAEAMRGYNDDAIMAAAIGCWVRDTFLAPNAVGSDIQRKLLDGITYSTHMNTEIAGASKDPKYARKVDMSPALSMDSKEALRIRLPNGHVADFNWLLQ